MGTDTNAAQSACVKNWRIQCSSHCYYTVAPLKTAECGRMWMKPHSSYIYPCLALLSAESIPAGLRLKGGKPLVFRQTCVRAGGEWRPPQVRAQVACNRPRWRSHRCERSKISNTFTGTKCRGSSTNTSGGCVATGAFPRACRTSFGAHVRNLGFEPRYRLTQFARHQHEMPLETN